MQNQSSCFVTIANDIIGGIDAHWSEAVVSYRIVGEVGQLDCIYKTDSSDLEFEFLVTFATYQAFQKLHQIAIDRGSNVWELASFRLKSTGKFSIDFDSR